MNTQHEAIKYLNLGFSVFPIAPGSKRPMAPWLDFQTRRMSAGEALKQFKPDDNIALACGDVSGVLVIDLDTYKEKGGDMELTSPLSVTTPRGGKHLYYKYKEGTGNTVNQAMAVDIRSKGGYVLIPPSTVDGRGYTWNTFPTRDILANLPEAPAAALEKIYKTAANENKPALNPADAFFIEEGGRNATLHKYSVSFIRKMGEEAAWVAIVGANQKANPPLPDNELKTLFNSALKFTRTTAPLTPQNHQKPPLVENSGFKQTTTKEDFEGVKKMFREGKKTGIPSGFVQLDAITGGLLPGQSYLVYADTNVGKSVFVVNMVVSLAKRGVKCIYFDLENSMDMTVERMMYSANDGKVTLNEWRKAVATKNSEFTDKHIDALEPYLGNVSVWDLNKLNDRFGEILWEGVKKCSEEAIRGGAQVIVIDHLHYFSPGETDHSVLGEVSRQLNNLAAIHNVAVLLVAHTRKGLAQSDKTGNVVVSRPTIDHINGSGMIAKHFKNIVALKRNAAAVSETERSDTKVYVDKTKFGPAGSFSLTYDEKSLCFREDLAALEVARTAMDLWDSAGEQPKEAETLVVEDVKVTASPNAYPTFINSAGEEMPDVDFK